jgi:hypothetical protein
MKKRPQLEQKKSTLITSAKRECDMSGEAGFMEDNETTVIYISLLSQKISCNIILTQNRL